MNPLLLPVVAQHLYERRTTKRPVRRRKHLDAVPGRLPAPPLSRPGVVDVTVRELDAGRAGPAVDAVFAALSPASRFLRFHSPAPRLTAGVRARLVDLDGRYRAAVVAEAPGGRGGDPNSRIPVGIARLAGPGSGAAEVAVAVADAWQRRGVGTLLLTALSELAGRIGYTELHGAVLPHNAAMLGLVRAATAVARSTWDGEVVQLVVPIGPTAWTITDADLLTDLLRR